MYTIHHTFYCVLALRVTLCLFRLALQGYSVASLPRALRFGLAFSVALLPQALCFALTFSVALLPRASCFALAFSVALLPRGFLLRKDKSVLIASLPTTLLLHFVSFTRIS